MTDKLHPIPRLLDAVKDVAQRHDALAKEHAENVLQLNAVKRVCAGLNKSLSKLQEDHDALLEPPSWALQIVQDWKAGQYATGFLDLANALKAWLGDDPRALPRIKEALEEAADAWDPTNSADSPEG